MEKEIQKLWDSIKKNTTFLLINHIRMDGDAFWSLGALYFILKKLGKEVRAINDDPIPDELRFLTKQDIIQTHIDFDKFKPDIIIGLDAGSPDRFWESYEKNKVIFQNTPFIIIDHHITNKHFWLINIVDTKSASTCEILYDIFKVLGYEDLIDEQIATLLLTGIFTDTNIFYNKNTTPTCLYKAWELIEKGGKNREIIFELFRKKSLNKLKLWGDMLMKLKSYAWEKIISVSVKKEEYDAYGLDDLGVKWLLGEHLCNIEWAEVAFMLYETKQGKIKASLRSNNDTVDVAEYCEKKWGGGHKLAAWFMLEWWNIEQKEKKIAEELILLLDK